MKKILLGMPALVATLALTACSGGGGSTAGGTDSASTTATSVPSSSATVVPTSTVSPPPSTTASNSVPPTPNQPPQAKPVADPGVPCAATVSACLDLSAHKAWLLTDGKVSYGPVPALPGRPGHSTPVGTFKVYSKEKMHLSKQFGEARMPNSVFFYPGDAFHAGSLSVYSHGCVHLSNAASLKFFNTLSIGDVVQVVP